jgi:hypothetical protein
MRLVDVASQQTYESEYVGLDPTSPWPLVLDRHTPITSTVHERALHTTP